MTLIFPRQKYCISSAVHSHRELNQRTCTRRVCMLCMTINCHSVGQLLLSFFTFLEPIMEHSSLAPSTRGTRRQMIGGDTGTLWRCTSESDDRPRKLEAQHSINLMSAMTLYMRLAWVHALSQNCQHTYLYRFSYIFYYL